MRARPAAPSRLGRATWLSETRDVGRRERKFVNSTVFLTWQLWAVLSAIFAALTAIFAKVGVAYQF